MNRAIRAFRPAPLTDICTCCPDMVADILQPAGPADIASESQLWR
jgi:hypothetical protein